MGALGNLIPLIILFLVVGGFAWVGYQIYIYSNDLADRGVRKMEKKNIVFSKDGARVSVKEMNAEDYADKTQRAFIKTLNAAHGDGSAGKKSPSTSRSSSYTSSGAAARPSASRSASSRK